MAVTVRRCAKTTIPNGDRCGMAIPIFDCTSMNGITKLYWVTRENNPARKLYDKYGEADDYVRYRLTL
jgi:sugar (pentulose or hexulose) kinase